MTEQHETPRNKRRLPVYLVSLIGLLGFLLCIIIPFFWNFFPRYRVDGVSMNPALQPGDLLIISRLAYFSNEPQRGDIIVFDFSGSNPDDYSLKRVVGLPGEEVTIEQGQLYIDGALLNEPYVADENRSSSEGQWFVPDDSYFVLGDNRASSSDSRSWGFLERDAINGKAIYIFAPASRLGSISSYDYSDLP